MSVSSSFAATGSLRAELMRFKASAYFAFAFIIREGIFMLLDMHAMPRATMVAAKALFAGALAYIPGSEL